MPWIIPRALARGAVTLTAGLGGGAKTAHLINTAVGLAAGRRNVGPMTVAPQETDGLRVKIISGEDTKAALKRLIAAASIALALTPAKFALRRKNLTICDVRRTGWRLGEPKPGAKRDALAPREEDVALKELDSMLSGTDLIILNTCSTLFWLPSENDNNAIGEQLARLSAMLEKHDCAAWIIHHSPKWNIETAAANRGEATSVRNGGCLG